jgi:large subunit ribosomal protein L5
MKKSRLVKQYIDKIRPELQQQLRLKNIMMVPKLLKIVLNVGLKEAVSDSKVVQETMAVLEKIAGQYCVKRLARKSIAGFKLREGMPIGVMVTLRGDMMYNFLDKLITFALPKVRDFQGLSTKLDGRGGYNIGIKDWTVFPEVDFDLGKKAHGMNITIQTSSSSDSNAYALLQAFNMPFKKS